MREVEGLEVPRVEARTLGAVVVAPGTQGFGGRGILDDRADLVAQELAERLVGLRAGRHVGKGDGQQVAGVPRRLVHGAARLLGNLQGIGHRDRGRDPDLRQARGLPVGVAIGLEGVELFLRCRAIECRPREIRCPLEYGHLRGLPCDDRDRLDARRPAADHRYALAGEVHALVGPVVRVIDLAAETAGTLDVDRFRQRQAAGGHHVEAAGDFVARAGTDVPAPGRGIPGGSLDAGGEADVPAQIVLVGHVVGVGEDLGLRGVLLRPLPLALELRVEAVRVIDRHDVAAGAGVAVPVPGAADAVGGLEHHGGESEAAQAVQHVEPGESGPDHHDVNVRPDAWVCCQPPCISSSSGQSRRQVAGVAAIVAREGDRWTLDRAVVAGNRGSRCVPRILPGRRPVQR